MRAKPFKNMELFTWNQFGSKLEDSQKRRKKVYRYWQKEIDNLLIIWYLEETGEK